MQSTQSRVVSLMYNYVIGLLLGTAIVAALLIVPAFWLDPGNHSFIQIIVVPGALLSAVITNLVLLWGLRLPWKRALLANFTALIAYPFCFVLAGIGMIVVRMSGRAGPEALKTTSDLVLWATAALAASSTIGFAMIRAVRPELAQPVAPPE